MTHRRTAFLHWDIYDRVVAVMFLVVLVAAYVVSVTSASDVTRTVVVAVLAGMAVFGRRLGRLAAGSLRRAFRKRDQPDV
jgi:hypothetical protein